MDEDTHKHAHVLTYEHHCMKSSCKALYFSWVFNCRLSHDSARTLSELQPTRVSPPTWMRLSSRYTSIMSSIYTNHIQSCLLWKHYQHICLQYWIFHRSQGLYSIFVCDLYVICSCLRPTGSYCSGPVYVRTWPPVSHDQYFTKRTNVGWSPYFLFWYLNFSLF